MNSPNAFTGRARRKQTRWSVKWADTCAQAIISTAGIGTILAVSMVFVCLAWVAWPLFQSAEISQPEESAAPWAAQALAFGVDEYRTIVWALMPDGKIKSFRYDTGEPLSEETVISDESITAASLSLDGTSVTLGYSDGTVRVGRIGTQTTFPTIEDVPKPLRSLVVGAPATLNGGLLERTSQGDLRLQKLSVELSEPVSIADEKIRLIDHLVEEGANKSYHVLAAVGDSRVRLCELQEKVNVLTEEVTFRVQDYDLPWGAGLQRATAEGDAAKTTPARKSGQDLPTGPPAYIALEAVAKGAYIAWGDGRLLRFDARDLKAIELVERTDVVDPATAMLTAMQMQIGRSTLLTGDSTGRASAWFVPIDQRRLVRAHDLPGPDAAVTSLTSSSRSRTVAVGYANGEVQVFYATTQSELASAQIPSAVAIRKIVLAPQGDAVLAITNGQLWRARFYAGFPEASFTALFMPVWYENYEEPEHVWQSGGGSDDVEPKLGLRPLIFGTIKATFYSMLFGAPLALLAAIYTSEFMQPRLRSRVKPLIELMASLPSVVLGFLAGIVLAPYLETLVPAMLAMFVTVPLALLLGAHLWQLLPQEVSLRGEVWRLPLFLVTVPLGILAATRVGPAVEQLLFTGNIRQWLAGNAGSATGGWMIIMLPLSALVVTFLIGSVINPSLRNRAINWNRRSASLLSLAKFCLGVLATVGVALACSWLLTVLGFDPRGSYVGKYDSRNALVVGFIMGFAIIPIIYTIADDALSTVPRHLRSGSFGAGATRWQTAVKIVIPTAMSGLFSALMVGLGRAVGETMIVLMATGNTPVMDWNLFNGFRTLSANIAVELPEASRDSAHYRTLFLAALVLFLLTFVVNTAAEIVRSRFRRRAYQL